MKYVTTAACTRGVLVILSCHCLTNMMLGYTYVCDSTIMSLASDFPSRALLLRNMLNSSSYVQVSCQLTNQVSDDFLFVSSLLTIENLQLHFIFNFFHVVI
jgi:hypothetical protein